MTKWQRVKRIGGEKEKPAESRGEKRDFSIDEDWMEAFLLEGSGDLGERNGAGEEDLAAALVTEAPNRAESFRISADRPASRGVADSADEDWASLLAEEDKSVPADPSNPFEGNSGKPLHHGESADYFGGHERKELAALEKHEETEAPFAGPDAGIVPVSKGRTDRGRPDAADSSEDRSGAGRSEEDSSGEDRFIEGRTDGDRSREDKSDGDRPSEDRSWKNRSGQGGPGKGDSEEAGSGKGNPEKGKSGKGKSGKGRQAGNNSAPGTNGDALEPIPDDIEEFVERLKEEAGYKTSFDVIVRQMTLGGKKTAFFMLNGLSSGQLMTEILERLTFLQADAVTSHALESFMNLFVPAVQVEQEKDWNMMMTGVLSGSTGMYIDGESTMLIIDTKMFPMRGPEEPSLERVVRGSRDGFVETMLMNVSLVRRRLRDPMLRLENIRVGERTRSDVCVAYIEDIADKELVESIRDKITAVKLDGIPLADKQLEEATVKRGWNPYPLVRYSERPDVVAAHLLEGNVAVFVDTSPSVMILPTTFFDLVQHAEENRQTPFIGTYLRWLRFFGIMASLFLVPIWLLFAMNPHLLPPSLAFIGPAKLGKLPLFVQFLLAEAGIDLMRMAAIHTPTPLAMAISLVSAILVGDIAVQTGLFINEVILYMAIAAIGMFATPSYELSLANRIVRLLLICLVAAFHIPGLVLGWTAVFVLLVMQRSFNRPYMWPFIPFDPKGMVNIMLRMPVMKNKKRPNLLRPQQRDKMPDAEGG
nr:spore germination protein [Paenibacillus humicus]